ncbi:MAG: hypothetical protein C4560_08670 [Nitrospiraceae bacterium]|nr:MAG: hypothetical protein C4560_08670 [Nitrospiraceae bacterium]
MINKTKIHFYGRYNLADLSSVFNILKDINEYETTYDFYKDRKSFPYYSLPDSVNFILSENNGPDYCRGKNIDISHGYGPVVGFSKDKNSCNNLINNFFSICVYGKFQKDILLDIGYPEEKIIIFGMPYSIDLLKKTDVDDRNKFLLSKGLNPENKTLLYAPTWNQWFPNNITEKVLFKFFNIKETTRHFFELWWQDGKEYIRVEKLCKFCMENGINFIVRMHERQRYDKDWLEVYSNIFDKYNVTRHYMDDDINSLQYLKYSDVLLGDISTINTYYYVMNKPVVHLNRGKPFNHKLKTIISSMDIKDRPGYIVDDFEEMLEAIKDSFQHPDRFEKQRTLTVKKYIDFTGDECIDVIKKEFKRIFQLK